MPSQMHGLLNFHLLNYNKNSPTCYLYVSKLHGFVNIQDFVWPIKCIISASRYIMSRKCSVQLALNHV